jgi:hypothetical protein
MLKTVTNIVNVSQITGVLPVVNGGTGVTTSTGTGNVVLSAAPTLSGDVSLSTGNLVIGTSGKGIDFSATPGTGTSELLADYEEGTFTPAQGSGLIVVGAYSSVGRYTKIGRTVFVSGILIGATTISTVAGTQMFTGLPFTILENAATGTFSNTALDVIGGIGAFGTQAYSTTTVGPTTGLDFSFSYTV